ncbi:hypothetical protein MUS1_11180 [Marinomonas ushuaiensis DSM 15871]|uniref:NACHT domain-containing protein n=1 Tax=Marinomonas ushuaiensis DSM 15871 TaxID=1122207 RepID=X7E8F5_9GAMM|nr:NACHT domain-containing protein [Marinomonas ushuaiensis]ETX11408.1 hypothetical protein MUS1_11180 [Marinomonas ushuaiensis DSM 15871]
MEAVTTTLTMVALKQTVTYLTKKLLDTVWDHDTEAGKELLKQLSEDYTTHTYVDKYVSRQMKMRTLHSAESDVYLDEIYTPLKLKMQSNGDEIIVTDHTTLTFSNIINIVGLAGQGKSTILRKLFLEEMKNGKRFPFIIELRRVENGSILDYFKEQLIDIGLSFSDGDVELLLQSKKIVFMLDGFDEIASINRLRLLNEIIQLKTRFNCNVIVTTRPDTEICNEPNITNLRVMNLKKNDIIAILSKLDKKNNLSELPELITNNIPLQETLITPILVNLLYVCYPYLDIVPENIIDFYDKLFITLYSRHDKIKNFNRERNSKTSSIDANNIFNAFSFDSINKGALDFTEESLYNHLKSAIKLNQISLEDIEKIQKDFINITCLIQKDGFDKYVYLHKSVQEFHAAKFIASLPHKHKGKFYKKLAEVVDIEDKFDNVLQFLKKIDTDDYNSLLVIEYFNLNKLTQLEYDKKNKIIDDIIRKILISKKINFNIFDGVYDCDTMEVIANKNLLSTLSLFKEGRRMFKYEAEEIFFDHLFENVSINLKQQKFSMKKLEIPELMAIEKKSKINTREGDLDNTISVSAFDYLQASGGYEEFSNIIKTEIIQFYSDIYDPIHSKSQEVSIILDMDFDI